MSKNLSKQTPRIAIVGSGPSGCYMAQFLRKHWDNASITIYDRDEHPYGLMRYGVAPDHLGTKGIAKQFDRLFEREGVRFIGSTEVGQDLSMDELRTQNDVVVLATGLWGDRLVDGFHRENGSPQLPGIYGSGELTRMINGHPHRDAASIRIGKQTIIVGNGNVAIDLVRLILLPPEKLAELGVPGDAIDALSADGPVERIDVVGRSVAQHVKFDVAMLRELSNIPDVRFVIHEDELEQESANDDSQEKLDVLHEVSNPVSAGSREVHFRFGWTPDRLLGTERLAGAVFRDTGGTRGELSLEADSVCTAVGFTEVKTDALLRRSFEGEDTDISAGVLADGLYCVGWLRRGPVGTIPANRADARTVANRIIADVDSGAIRVDTSGTKESDFALPQDLASTDLLTAEIEEYLGETRPTREVVLLYGTESGNAETVADVLVEEFSDEFMIRAVDMTDATIADLSPDHLALVICSTHGEGALPSSAVPFTELLDAEAPDLTNVRYAMFGMGDSSYELYSRGSEHIDDRLSRLGGTRMGEYGRHDAVDGTLPNDQAIRWGRGVLEAELAGTLKEAEAKVLVHTTGADPVAPSRTVADPVDQTHPTQVKASVAKTVGRAGSSRIPADLTLHYDPFSYADYDYPYDLFKRLRDEAPVYYNEERDIFIISRYRDVRACFADTKRFSSARGNDIDGTHESIGQGFLVTVDPPRHTALRAAIRRTFSAKEILAKEDGTREYVRSLLEPFWEQGGGDFTAEVGFPAGVGMAVMLLGRPLSDVPAFVDHIERELVRVVGAPGVPEDANVAVVETEEMIAERFAERNAEIDAGINPTGTDAMTQIILAVHAGKVMPEEQVGLAHLVLAAASDAPAAFLSQVIMLLDRFPNLQPFLHDNPDMIPAFVEESLRYDTPAQNASRQTLEDVEIAGTVIPANSRVTLLQGSANRDERVYDNPDEFDITREITPANRIMSFGEGTHSCMGAPFIRLTARVLVEEIVKGPEVRIVGLPERFSKQLIRGFAKLPVRFKS
ncbi:MAG: cytochrome P450 [Gulosibacter sp.]|uniref:cytochrome P450 n=1 Tax=Gulosibacter sp. TaxID=2817531 RepID=UPI003F9381C1